MGNVIVAIALDLGITTGYGEGYIQDGCLHAITGQEKWEHLELWQHLEDLQPHHVISERFTFRPVRPGTRKTQTGAELYSRELIGVANLFCQMHDRVFHLQNVMKDRPTTYFNNAQLRRDGFYKANRDHANDAARHLLYWFQFGPGFKFNEKGYKPAS